MVAHFTLRTNEQNKVYFRKINRIWRLFRCNQMPSTNRYALLHVCAKRNEQTSNIKTMSITLVNTYTKKNEFDFRDISNLDFQTRSGFTLFKMRIRIKPKHPSPDPDWKLIRIFMKLWSRYGILLKSLGKLQKKIPPLLARPLRPYPPLPLLLMAWILMEDLCCGFP